MRPYKLSDAIFHRAMNMRRNEIWKSTSLARFFKFSSRDEKSRRLGSRIVDYKASAGNEKHVVEVS